MPPVARIGKPGMALAMADTALRAIGLMALPAHNGQITKCFRVSKFSVKRVKSKTLIHCTYKDKVRFTCLYTGYFIIALA